MKRTITLTLLLLSFIYGRDTLVIAYGSHNGEPYIFRDDSGLVVGGILKDIGDTLSRELSVDVIFHEVPRKRLEMALNDGTAHVYMKGNPKWVADSTRFLWSRSLFREEDILLLRKGSEKQIESPKDLKGLRMGTILGYHYSALDSLFEAGFLQRQDVTNLYANIQKLQMKRLDCLVDSDILIHYQLKKKDIQDLKVAQWVAASIEVFNMVSPKCPVPLDSLNRVYSDMHERGSFEEILNHYR